MTTRRLAAAAAALTIALFAIRLFAAGRIGFGDSEALYACYAIHPQPAYLDHPGLIGTFARAIAARGAPTPHEAHLMTALIVTLVPWLAAAAARGAGATARGAFVTALTLMVVPEIAIGLFAMTPDLILACAWIGALGAGCAGLRSAPASNRAAWALFGAGLCAGIATASKVTGATLFVALACAYASRHAREHARTIWPWAGLVAGALVVLPVAIFEARTGWPILHHRLIDTQQDAGISLRNAAAIVVGQLGYLSPLVAVGAFFVARDLVRTRGHDAPSALLFYAFAFPAAILAPLCLWSRVAEPHWLAPPFLALAVHLGRTTTAPISRRFGVAAIATSLAMVLAVHAWVLIADLTRLMPASFDPRHDITSELYGWPRAIDGIRRIASESSAPGFERGDVVIVGPHWVICAQIEAALNGELPVGCATPIRDDFDGWYPRAHWRAAEVLIFVTDNRFATDRAAMFPDYVAVRQEQITVMRGGRPARTFSITVLARRAAS